MCNKCTDFGGKFTMERSRVLSAKIFGLRHPGPQAAKVSGKHIKTSNDVVEGINARLRKECEELTIKDKKAEVFAASIFAGE